MDIVTLHNHIALIMDEDPAFIAEIDLVSLNFAILAVCELNSCWAIIAHIIIGNSHIFALVDEDPALVAMSDRAAFDHSSSGGATELHPWARRPRDYAIFHE